MTPVHFGDSWIWACTEEFDQIPCCHCFHFSFIHQRIWVDIITELLDLVHLCKSGLIYVNIFYLISFLTRLSESSHLFLKSCYFTLKNIMDQIRNFSFLSRFHLYSSNGWTYFLFYKRDWQNHLFVIKNHVQLRAIVCGFLGRELFWGR